MATFAEKYFTGNPFDCDTEGYEFCTLGDLFESNGADAVYRIKGLWINEKSKYGDHPVAICEGFFADFPKHMTEQAIAILHDKEAIQQIKAGEVGFKIHTYKDAKYGKTCYSPDWVDLEPGKVGAAYKDDIPF